MSRSASPRFQREGYAKFARKLFKNNEITCILLSAVEEGGSGIVPELSKKSRRHPDVAQVSTMLSRIIN